MTGRREPRIGAVRLVAAREIVQRGRSRAFVVATALLLAASIGGVLLATYLPGRSTHRVDVAVLAAPDEARVGGDAQAVRALREALVSLGTTFELQPRFVEVASAADADAALRDGRADVVVDGGVLRWHESVDRTEEAWLRTAVQQVVVSARADRAGVPLATLDALEQPVQLEATVLDPVADDEGVRIGTATVGVIVLFITVQMHGMAVLMGVVEEKSTRVVEVLLNHVRPRDLLAGKVVGIGAVALAQVVVVAAGALVTLFVVRDVDVPRVPATAIVWFVVWFVLGFAVYATLLGTAGSLVSRQEDAQAVAGPALAPLIVTYVLSISLVSVPDSALARVLSIVPLSAPMAMPVRLATGHPAAWEVVLALALCLVLLQVLVRVGGRVYAANLLRTGSRVAWRQALRQARRAPTN